MTTLAMYLDEFKRLKPSAPAPIDEAPTPINIDLKRSPAKRALLAEIAARGSAKSQTGLISSVFSVAPKETNINRSGMVRDMIKTGWIANVPGEYTIVITEAGRAALAEVGLDAQG
jgi:hypothetical protein